MTLRKYRADLFLVYARAQVTCGLLARRLDSRTWMKAWRTTSHVLVTKVGMKSFRVESPQASHGSRKSVSLDIQKHGVGVVGHVPLLQAFVHKSCIRQNWDFGPLMCSVCSTVARASEIV